MDVQIIEIGSDLTAATITVAPAGQPRIPTESDFFNEAWRCAVMEHSVDAARRDDYRFRMTRG